MRASAILLAVSSLGLALSGAEGRAGPAYEGVWGSTKAACRDEDGVDRMVIAGKRLAWYETRCRAETIEPAGARSWAMRLSCEGEGRHFRARPQLTLPTRDRLVMTNSPVGRERRQAYLRCAAR